MKNFNQKGEPRVVPGLTRINEEKIQEEEMRRRMLFLALVLSLSAVPCSLYAAESETESETSGMINGFRGFKWGSTIDEVQKKESGAMEPKETSLGDGTVTMLEVMTDVGGYDAGAAYIFDDSGLIMGSYDTKLDDEELLKLSEKYADVYGEPVISKESTGWGPCWIWADEERNSIVITGFDDVIYSSCDNPYLEKIFDGYDKYFSVDIVAEINRVGNHNGI